MILDNVNNDTIVDKIDQQSNPLPKDFDPFDSLPIDDPFEEDETIDPNKLAREAIIAMQRGEMPDNCDASANFNMDGTFAIWGPTIEEAKKQLIEGGKHAVLKYIKDQCVQDPDLRKLLEDEAEEQEMDYDELVREYCYKYLFNGIEKPEAWPESGFGEYESIISQYERHVRKGVPAKAITENIKKDDRLKHLFEDDESLQDGDEEVGSFVELPEKARISPEVSKGACQWLDDYIAYSKKASPEAYEDFHAFVGMWVLSVIHARRSYIPFGSKRIYGNLNIVLCAITSTAAKSHTADIGIQVLSKAGLSYMLGAQKTTPEKLVSSMSGKHIPANYDQLSDDKKEFVRRKIAMSGQKGLYRDEFGKFIREVLKKESSSSGWIELLLEIYNCSAEYNAETISRGSDTVYNPYIALLGAMTYPDIKSNGKGGSDFWLDGFWARFGFIAAPSNYNKIATLDAGEEIPLPFHLIKTLAEWNNQLGLPHCEIVMKRNSKGDVVEGEYEIIKDDESFPATRCTISPEANLAYKRYRETLKELFPQFKHQDFNGSYDRLSEQALRDCKNQIPKPIKKRRRKAEKAQEWRRRDG